MKFSPIAQSPLEWLALKAGLVPTPLSYSHFGFMISKFLLEAVDKGVFEAIGHKKVSLEQIAQKCSLNKKALKSLIPVLASMRLIDHKDNLFFLSGKSKKWILKDSPDSLYWLMIFDNRVCLKWMDHVGSFLQSGKGLQYHESLSEEEWFYYQKAMEAAALATSKEAVRKIPIPPHATKMLDIGGAHGLYSVALCKKNPALSSVIFDLPSAVEAAKSILDKYAMADRIRHQPGNALLDDIGTELYNIILMGSLAHHFTYEENVRVAKKAFNALKQGGFFVIMEVLKSERVKQNGDMLSALGDFFFALSSTSGLWSLKEIRQWQKEAGFSFYKKASFLTIPGYTAIIAQKP